MGLHKGQTNSGSFRKGQISPRKGITLSQKTKDKISKSVSIIRTGTHHTQQTKDKISTSETGKFVEKGEDSKNWKGGHEASERRSDLSRLGFNEATPLNEWMPGTERHHITNHYIVYIPRKIHRQFYGYKREEHRRKVMEVLEQELPILFSFITMYLWNSTEIPRDKKLSD